MSLVHVVRNLSEYSIICMIMKSVNASDLCVMFGQWPTHKSGTTTGNRY